MIDCALIRPPELALNAESYEFTNTDTNLKMLRKKLFLIIVSLIFIDQLSKYIVRHLYGGGFYICNEGVGFGIKIPEVMFFFLWIGIVISLIYLWRKKYFVHNTWYVILILSGAVSNIADRIFYGCVTDFIDLKIWPVFNLADSFIAIGAVMLIFGIIGNKGKKVV